MPLRLPFPAAGGHHFRAPGLLAAALTLGVGLTACTMSPSTSAPPVRPVLGHGAGSPEVEGQPAPSGTGELGAVSCADASHCWAVGVAAPATGTQPTPPAVIVATADGGVTWRAQPLSVPLTPDLTGIACPSATTCMAVGSVGANPPIGAVLTTRNSGTNWRSVSIPPGALAVISVSCATTADCVVLVSDGTILWSATTTDFGHTWEREGNLPTGLEGARDLSCTAAGTCLVAGNTATATGHGQGSVIVSTDGGAAWTAANVPAGTGLLQDARCASATRCLAVGTTSDTVSDVVPAQGALLESNDGGHTWLPAVGVQPVNNVFGIACPSPLQCVMVGTQWVNHTSVGVGAVASSSDGGQTFTADRSVYTPLSLTAVTCPTAATCIAVGGDTVARIALPDTVVPIPRRR